MKLKLRLRHKIQLIITSISVVVFTGAISYISIKDRQSAYENQTNLIEAQTEKYANEIKVLINEDFAVARTLALAFKTFQFYDKDEYQQLVNRIYDFVFSGNPEFYQLWDSWELSAIDSTWSKPTGRISNTRFREKGEVKSTINIRSLDGDNEYYAKDKALARELVSEIYADAFIDKKAEQKIMTAFEAPIMLNKQFVGLIGIDVTLDRFQEIVSAIELKKLDGSYAFLLSHNGKYAAHPNNELLNTKAHQNPTNLETFNLFQRIELGEAFSVTHINEGDDRFVSYFPIKIGRTDTYWYLGISVPKASINKAVNENLYVSLVVGILGLIIMSIVIYVVALSITRPVQAVTGQLRNLAQGQISTKNTLNLRTGDEIQEMAEALNETIEKLNYKNVFAKRLGDGDLQYKFDIENGKDELGLSLVEMQQNLLKAREEEEKRKQEDKINQWTNKAITETSDIFRRHNKNIQELSFITLQYLLDYLDIVQGGIYVRNDDEEEPYYELVSAIAFGRDKLIECKIKEEEGLVGRCGYEKLTVSLTEIPDNYVDIKSGLGGANPNNILLVPLKSNELVYGVVELISFKPIDDYKISLVEQVGGNLAATIANVKINEKTEKLLRQSQQQAEELARQEQEMRQNVEEMKVTQEGAQQREQEMQALHDAVNDIAYLAEFDMDGHLIEMNKNLEILLAKPKEQMIGMQQGAFGENADPEQFQTMWNQLRNGSSVTHEQRITTGSTDVWLLETYKPILNADGEPYKVINIAIDITHTKS